MRRTVTLCLLSFALGAVAAWRYLGGRGAEPALLDDPADGSLVREYPADDPRVDEPWVDDTPTGRIPVLSLDTAEVTAHRGSLHEPLAEETAAPAGPRGTAPSAEYTVKAADGRFHTAESPHYAATTATVWFRTEADAHRAGFTPWHR